MNIVLIYTIYILYILIIRGNNMFVCLNSNSSSITGYMKVLENELNVMLMLDYEFLKKDIEIAIAETENNVIIAVSIDNMILTECEKGIRLKAVSMHNNNLKGNSTFIIIFKVNEDFFVMMDENIFKNYDLKRVENFINFLDFKKLDLNKGNNKDKVESNIDEKNDVEVESSKKQVEDFKVNIEEDSLKEIVLCEPEVVCDLNSKNDLKDVDMLPEITSFFKDKTNSLNISLKRAFINAILSFLPIYNIDCNLKNTFIFTKEDNKEIEFIKIKKKDLENKNNIFLILIQNMINELNFSNIATHIYLGIERDSKESIAILFALSKDTFKAVEDVIEKSDIRVLKTGLNDEFHYIIYECLI